MILLCYLQTEMLLFKDDVCVNVYQHLRIDSETHVCPARGNAVLLLNRLPTFPSAAEDGVE